MPKGWRITVERNGGKHPLLVGISDQTRAEAAAKKQVGGGDVLTCDALTDDDFAKLALISGQVKEGASMWNG